jgi:hypothetical protein
MARVRRQVLSNHLVAREVVGTKHDTVGPCALCTVLLAEGVTGEGWHTGSILDTPELRELLELHHRRLELWPDLEIFGTPI